MAEPFMGEIKMVSFNYPPKHWATCDGQLLPIAQNQALFSLIGTNFGGDGRSTFALPDLRGRCATHGGGAAPGPRGGEENHTLSVGEIPTHTHIAFASGDKASTPAPQGAALAVETNLYGPAANLLAITPQTIGMTGNSQGHNNMQPTLVINFCIALSGMFPSPS